MTLGVYDINSLVKYVNRLVTEINNFTTEKFVARSENKSVTTAIHF